MRATTLVFGVILAAAVVGCSSDPAVLKQSYLESGNEHAAAQRYREAILEYRNALQQDPQFGEARLKLAEASLRIGDYGTAYSEYIRAADLLPQNVSAQLNAASMRLAAREFEEAAALADKVLAIEPGNVDAVITKANAAAGLDNVAQAVSDMEEAITLDPERGALRSSLGVLQQALGNPERAEAAFKTAVSIDPTSINARLALANFYWQVRRPADAERELLGALEVDPTNDLANRAVAVFYINGGRVAEAEPHLKLLAERPNPGTTPILLADYYLTAGRAAEGEALLRKIVATDPSNEDDARGRLVALAIRNGDYTSAKQLLDESLLKSPANVDFLVAKAELQVHDQQLDAALATAMEAREINPRAANAHLVLGRIHVARREWEDATAALNQSVNLAPRNTAARLELARLALAQGRMDEGLQFAQEAIVSRPLSVEAHLMFTRALIAKGDVAGADARLKLLAPALPRSAALHAQQGQVFALKGDVGASRKSYERALSLDPRQLDALTGISALDLNQGAAAAAVARIAPLVAAEPANAPLLLLAARIYLSQEDPRAAEHVLRQVIEADHLQLDAYEMLGQIYAVENRFEEARAELAKIASLRPRASVGAQTLIGMLFEIEKRYTEAQTTYERVLALDQRAGVAANNLAYIYAERGGNLDVALQLAQTAKGQMPDRHEIDDTLGWVYLKKDLATLAVPPLEESVSKAPSNALYRYHLGMAYARVGNESAARTSLEEALRLDSTFEGAAEAQKLLASLRG